MMPRVLIAILGGLLTPVLMFAATGEVAEANGGIPTSPLINDLGVVMATAAIVAILFQKLRLPVIFGYLAAGVLIGPNLFEFSPIHDLQVVQELSELGVIFLLFYIGMEFDLRRLQRVIVPASLAIVLQTMAMVALGLTVAPMAGWSGTSGLFFGSLLAISSSMVTISVLRQQGKMNLPHAQSAIGILILEDILAVLLLVILTGVGVTGQLEWANVWVTVFIMAVFVVFVFFVGRLLAPPVLNFLNRLGSLELITIAAVGLVLGVSALAQNFSFSVALGAFVAGSILSQSRLAAEIERAVEPLRDLFGAVFFVAIGMLIEPRLLIENVGWIALLSVLVVLGKTLSCWIGLFLAGESSRRAFQGSTVKAQIGEFSFIIAALGERMGVTDANVTAVAVGVALVSILFTPLLGARSEELFEGMARLCPRTFRHLGDQYQRLLDIVQQAMARSLVLRMVRRPLLQIAGYFLIVNGLLLGAFLGAGYAERNLEWPYYVYTVAATWAAAALLSVPFLVAILRNVSALVTLVTEASFGTGSGEGRVRNLVNSILSLLILTIFGVIYFSAASAFLPRGVGLSILAILVLAIGVLFYRQMIRLNSRLEYFFMDSFNQSQHSAAEAQRQAVLEEISMEYPWPVEVREVEIPDQSLAVGRRISQVALRDRSGALIIALSRNDLAYYDPHPETPLFAGDRLILIGEDEQLNAAALYLETSAPPGEGTVRPRFGIEKLLLVAGSKLEGDTLAGANLRRRFGVTVVGIQRGPERITAPGADEILKAGDVLLVVGEPRAIERLRTLTEPQRVEAVVA